jgi:hypothetical protein
VTPLPTQIPLQASDLDIRTRLAMANSAHSMWTTEAPEIDQLDPAAMLHARL